MPEYPSGTVAFLFTDIEGSTKRWETDRQAMQAAVERHFALLQSAVVAQGGVLFKTVGDAGQAAFSTVADAIAAAIGAQAAFREEDWGAIGGLRVRMAIHAGASTLSDGDYLSPAINRLSHLLRAGHGDQIVLTDTARALATLPTGFALQALGPHRLRDLLEPESVFQLVGPGLPVSFAPLKSLDRELTNLPAQPTPLIGRERELATMHELLVTAATRLITLVGPGGTGKTRLALQSAAESLEAFPDGVWWVPLASVSNPELVPQAIATALGVRETPGEPLSETLATYLHHRQVLLVLDNLEHLLEATSHIRRLLDISPRLIILATSREPLRLRAEREFPVAPLSLPGGRAHISAQAALEFPAVRLFAERAQVVKSDFQVSDDNVAEVVAICRRLDGLPLAIELAAARVRILTPAALLARLDQRLTVLTGGARDLPARQQTLRATIGWSYDLLDPPEQMLFARLGVFAGGCTMEAADTVCGAAGGIAIELLDGIDSLVQKSLLRQEEASSGDARYTMLQTIHDFARERLEALPEVAELRQVHADLFLSLAESADWDDVSGQVDILDRLDADHANFRQAITHYEEQGAAGLTKRIRLTAALAHFWWVRGYLTEGRRALEAAIAASGEIPPADCVAAISGAALLAEAQGDLERAGQLHEEALTIHRALGDLRGSARALTGLGVIARQRGDMRTARAYHEEALDGWEKAADAAGMAGALLDLGVIRLLEGDTGGGEPVLRESLELFRKLRDEAGEANAFNALGLLAMSMGNVVEAIDHFEESLRRWRALGNQQTIATDLANLGEARHLAGSLDEAEVLYREAIALFESLGDPSGRGFVLSQLGLLALDRGNVTEAHRLLTESLRVRWTAGLRGAAADTVEALAEATWRQKNTPFAATLLHVANMIREETGVARQPVYESRYERLANAIGDLSAPNAPLDIDQTVAAALGVSPVAS